MPECGQCHNDFDGLSCPNCGWIDPRAVGEALTGPHMPRLTGMRERRHEDHTFGFYFGPDDISYGIAWRTMKRFAAMVNRTLSLDWQSAEDAAVGVQHDDLITAARMKDGKEFSAIASGLIPKKVPGVLVSNQSDTFRVDGPFFTMNFFTMNDASYIALGFTTSGGEEDLGLELVCGPRGQGVLSLAAVRRVQDSHEHGMYKIGKPIPIPPRQTFQLNVHLTDRPPDELTVVMSGLATREVL